MVSSEQCKNANGESVRRYGGTPHCFDSEIFVLLHCRKKRSESRPLRRKIASIKSRNCAH